MRIVLATAGLAAVLALAACDKKPTPTGAAPQGSDVAAAMPDTNQPRGPGEAMPAPDAGATGAVPASGAPPATLGPADQTPAAKAAEEAKK